MGRIIAVANQKGGVGKTTTSVNLAASLAVAEQPTLVIDIDPQANASSALGIITKDLEKTVYELLTGKNAKDVRTGKELFDTTGENLKEDMPAIEAIMGTDMPFLDVIPSHIRLVGAEIELVNHVERERVLAKKLEPLLRKYKYIIIDCPPSLGLLTLNALTAAHSVLVPVQCEYLSLEGLGQLLNTFSIVKQHLNQGLEVEGILMTMYDGRLNLSQQVVQEVRRILGDKVCETVITRNVRLAEAPSHGKPVLLYDAVSVGARNYLKLAEEIMAHSERIEARTAQPTTNMPATVASGTVSKAV